MIILETQRIIGGPSIPLDAIRALLTRHAPSITAPVRDDIAAAYTALGHIAYIGNLIPLAQAIKETGWFASPRWRQSFNPAGLGATNDGAWGSVFHNAAEGVIAHCGHLLAYAAHDEALSFAQKTLVLFDPRLEAVTKAGWRGAAPTWAQLSNKWNKGNPRYGNEILRIAREISG